MKGRTIDRAIKLIMGLIEGPVGPTCKKHLQTAQQFRDPDIEITEEFEEALEAMARCEDCLIRLELYRQVIRDVIDEPRFRKKRMTKKELLLRAEAVRQLLAQSHQETPSDPSVH